MRTIILTFLLTGMLFACKDKNPEAIKPLCENPCLSDTLKFTILNPFEPYVKIIPTNCLADSVVWSHKKLENRRKIHLSTFMESILALGDSSFRCYIKDTSYAYLVFNDCTTRRGYWLKLPFNKADAMEKSVSAINSIDPRYKVEDGLICYKSNNTIYVEEMMTGKKATVEVEKPKLEYNKMYEIIDSVHVTRNRIFMNLKDGKDVIPLEKTISLQ
ncbi:MAG: hypothetical protein GC171_10915 [Terrimonas sp.]|nr:hypothetical protein [Terrimonas sp.]